jgi:hypothetical protein
LRGKSTIETNGHQPAVLHAVTLPSTGLGSVRFSASQRKELGPSARGDRPLSATPREMLLSWRTGGGEAENSELRRTFDSMSATLYQKGKSMDPNHEDDVGIKDGLHSRIGQGPVGSTVAAPSHSPANQPCAHALPSSLPHGAFREAPRDLNVQGTNQSRYLRG